MDYEELTDKERAVLQHIWDGESTPGIADRLGVTVKTVEFHRGRIYRKWGVANSISACRLGLKFRYLTI